MTLQTTRTDLPPEQRAYVQSLFNALGDRDAMSVLRDTPAALRAAVDGVSRDTLIRPEAAGKWSALEVMQHLADSELVGAFRLRMIVAHDAPELPAYDQEKWAERLRYNENDPETVLEEFTMLRRANLRLIQRLTPEERRRVMAHSQRGTESIEEALPMYAGHDLVHLKQLRRILARP